MAGKKPREPGADKPHKEDEVAAQKPSIEVEREQAGVGEDEGRVKPAAPDETLLPPD